MVIQRWQSVLLFVAAAVMACFTFLSLGQITTEAITFNFTSMGLQPEGIPTDGTDPKTIHTWYFFMVNITTMFLLVMDIFVFRNMSLQRKLCQISILFIIAAGSIAGCIGYSAIPGGSIGWSSVALCPFIALAATIMAYSLILSDHRKLRNADRLR